MLSFSTLVSLSEWLNKKEQLEPYLNATLHDIKQDKENNRIINIFIQTEPLPEIIEWNDAYFEDDGNILNIGISHMGNITTKRRAVFIYERDFIRQLMVGLRNVTRLQGEEMTRLV